MRDDTTANLRVLRASLQRRITRYSGTVTTALLTKPTEESVELLQTILRPMITVRMGRTRANEPTAAEAKAEAKHKAEAEAEAPAEPVEPDPVAP